MDNISNLVSAIQKLADAKSPSAIPSQVSLIVRGVQDIGRRLAELEKKVAAQIPNEAADGNEK